MKSEKISTFLQSRIEAKDFPSAVYLVAEKGKLVFQDALGYAVVEPKQIKANIETIYDLASLTKPLVTGLLCAKLIEQGRIKIEEAFFRFSAFFNYGEKKEIKLQDLLLHTSGLPAWKPFYLIVNAPLRNIISSIISKEPLASEVGSRVTYSDLNFILLGFILESLFEGKRLAQIAKEEIFEPLNLKNTFFNPPQELCKSIAASERGNEYERQMCADLGYDISNYSWRDYQIWGEVHDGNCSFMNGVSGHAGLFSTADEVFKIAQQFLPETTQLLKPETCKLFRTNFTPNLNEARSMAFQLAETKDSTASDALPKNSFGHLGFTGTSLWIDPNKERIYILLTNRTHDRELPFANINGVRRRFHEIACSELTL